ncbi:MAG: hypothetical protein AAGA48_01670 [Myxococcota bacterium]
MAVSRSQFARLKRLLLARDVDLVVQGVDLVVALDDEELWARLLEGIRYDPDPEPRRWGAADRTGPTFTPNRLFTGTAPAQLYHDLAMVLLIAEAPDPTLRNAVTALRVRGQVNLLSDRWTLDPWPLDRLAAYPNLQQLILSVHPDAELGELARCARLEVLALKLRRERANLEGVGAIPSLRHLVVTGALRSTAGLDDRNVDRIVYRGPALPDTTGLGGHIDVLQVQAVHAVDLGGLRGAVVGELEVTGRVVSAGLADAQVTDLKISGFRQDDLPTVPGLRHLAIEADRGWALQPELEDLTLYRYGGNGLPLVEWAPKLRRVRIEASQLVRLDALRGLDELREVSILQSHVRSLDLLATLDVRTLCLVDNEVHHLDALPAAQLVDALGQPTGELRLAGAKSIQGLGSLVGLRTLSLRGCTHLRSLEGLEDTAIEVLDLRGCVSLANVDALAKMPDLRVVAVRGTSFHRDNVPPTDAVVTLAAHPRWDQPKRKPGSRRRRGSIPVPESQRAIWEGLKPLFTVANRPGLDRLGDYLADLGTPEIYEVLLSPVQGALQAAQVKGWLARADLRWRVAVLQRVLSDAPKDSADVARLTAGVTKILPSNPDYVVDTRGVERFAEVREVALYGKVVHVDSVAELPHLKDVFLRLKGPLSSTRLPALPQVRRVTISRGCGTVDLDFVRRMPGLQRLIVQGYGVADIEGLRGHPTLEHLELHYPENTEGLDVLLTLPSLRRLRLGWLGADDAMDLRTLPRLDELWLDATTSSVLERFPAEPAARLVLRVKQWHRQNVLGDFTVHELSTATQEPLTALPKGLTVLEIGIESLLDLPKSDVTTLRLRRANPLQGLDRMPRLQHLEVEGNFGSEFDWQPTLAVPLVSLRIRSRERVPLDGLADHPTLERMELPIWRNEPGAVPQALQDRVHALPDP